MITIFLIVLFITQVISFYFIALLYMKLAKFDDLEKKQNRLMKEMDDSIAVYLAEIKDENDQLLEKLTVQVDKNQKEQGFKAEYQNKQDQAQPDTDTPVQMTMPQQTMRHYARKSYATIQQNSSQEEKEEDVEESGLEDDHSRALQLSAAGFSIEEIARKLDKGRTEIELILKFK